jgi:hypothetical protein
MVDTIPWFLSLQILDTVNSSSGAKNHIALRCGLSVRDSQGVRVGITIEIHELLSLPPSTIGDVTGVFKRAEIGSVMFEAFLKNLKGSVQRSPTQGDPTERPNRDCDP